MKDEFGDSNIQIRSKLNSLTPKELQHDTLMHSNLKKKNLKKMFFVTCQTVLPDSIECARGVTQWQQKVLFFSGKKRVFCANSSYLHISLDESATSGSGAAVHAGQPAPGLQLFRSTISSRRAEITERRNPNLAAEADKR